MTDERRSLGRSLRDLAGAVGVVLVRLMPRVIGDSLLPTDLDAEDQYRGR